MKTAFTLRAAGVIPGGLIDWITRDPLCHASMAPRCMQALDSTGGALIVAAYLATAEGNHG